MNDRFIQACLRHKTDRVPVWFMRQAGRYMPQYREIRRRHSILEMCRTPELACQVTLQPLEVLDIDAAIIFSDLLLPLAPMGVEFDFKQGEGPVIFEPLRDAAAAGRLKSFDPEESLGFVLEAIRLVVSELQGRLPLIGFGGAPFTLASYMIEGGSSRHFEHTKSFMYSRPAAWKALMEFLVEHQASFLAAQARAGVAALQVFDSWLGALGPEDFRVYVQPYSTALLGKLADLGVPIIHFATGISGYIEEFARCGGNVVGVDWRVPLRRARSAAAGQAIQGNLDPVLLFAPQEELLRRAGQTLVEAGPEPGFIFNLGHGILPQTPVENVQALAAFVHSFRADGAESRGAAAEASPKDATRGSL